MPEPIISISGLRGIIGSELTPAVASRFAAAFCTQIPLGPVVLSRDGRVSGPMLADAIAATLVGHGRECLDVGVASTPTVGVFVRQHEAAGGIQISASHNPPAYNGMKLFATDGRVVPQSIGSRVLDAYRNGVSDWKQVDQLGARTIVADPHRPHLELVLATVAIDSIRRKNFRILLDSNHGAGAVLGETLLSDLGCTTQVLGRAPDGRFEHPPEPVAENLAQVGALVRDGGFHVGFCQDPDADRLAIIDEHGHYIGEEYTSVLCMMRALMSRSGPLVTNCASSNMTRWIAQQHQVPFVRSKVGEANVVDKMIEHDALYGGEGSGGPIDPRVGMIRDSFVGMAQVLDLMAATNKSISELVGSLPRMSMIKDKMTLSADKLAASMDLLRTELPSDRFSTEDGVRLDWPDAWLLLRGSNTEPIVRIIAEAPTIREAEELIQRAKAVIARFT